MIAEADLRNIPRVDIRAVVLTMVGGKLSQGWGSFLSGRIPPLEPWHVRRIILTPEFESAVGNIFYDNRRKIIEDLRRLGPHE